MTIRSTELEASISIRCALPNIILCPVSINCRGAAVYMAARPNIAKNHSLSGNCIVSIFAARNSSVLMFYVLLTMFAGVLVGWLLKGWKPVGLSGKAVSAVIWVMLFLLGAEIGMNRELLRSLSSIGLQALLFAAAGICGSVIASVLLYRLLFRKKAE